MIFWQRVATTNYVKRRVVTSNVIWPAGSTPRLCISSVSSHIHPCSGCASPAPHAGGRTNCPAWGKQCLACGKMNHFARSCRSSASGKPNPGNSYKPAKPQYKQFQSKPPAFNFQSGMKKFGKGKRKNFQQARQVLQEDPDDTDEDEPEYLFSIGIDDQCPFNSDCYDVWFFLVWCWVLICWQWYWL